MRGEDVLAEFGGPGCCEWCGRWWPMRHRAHIRHRGMGGDKRGLLNVRINLVSLCPPCHYDHHQGHRPLRCDLLALVAAREGRLQGEIEAEIQSLRRAT